MAEHASPVQTAEEYNASVIARQGLAFFKVGDRVQKISGYSWPGVVVSCFSNLAGNRRYVVECTVPEVAGALHIYSADQLRAAP